MEENTTTNALQARMDEVNQYEANIAMYKAIAASLPSVWPEHLAHLKGSKNHHQAISEIQSLDDVELVGKLWAHDAAESAIRTEMIEKAKAQAILSALSS